ncbi:MAG: hypothetical protein GY754_33865 [bacterium]|nr:hypothetical protein [bacterium]
MYGKLIKNMKIIFIFPIPLFVLSCLSYTKLSPPIKVAGTQWKDKYLIKKNEKIKTIHYKLNKKNRWVKDDDTTIIYNKKGKIIQVIEYYDITYNYDEKDNIILMSKKSTYNGDVYLFKFIYDKKGNIIEILKKEENSKDKSKEKDYRTKYFYTYNFWNNTINENNKILYTFDKTGKMIEEAHYNTVSQFNDNEYNKKSTFFYDKKGKLIRKNDFRHNHLLEMKIHKYWIYNYNKDGKIIEESCYTKSNYSHFDNLLETKNTWTYNAEGNPVEIKNYRMLRYGYGYIKLETPEQFPAREDTITYTYLKYDSRRNWLERHEEKKESVFDVIKEKRRITRKSREKYKTVREIKYYE